MLTWLSSGSMRGFLLSFGRLVSFRIRIAHTIYQALSQLCIPFSLSCPFGRLTLMSCVYFVDRLAELVFLILCLFGLRCRSRGVFFIAAIYFGLFYCLSIFSCLLIVNWGVLLYIMLRFAIASFPLCCFLYLGFLLAWRGMFFDASIFDRPF